MTNRFRRQVLTTLSGSQTNVGILYFWPTHSSLGFFSGSETALFSIGKVAQARLQVSERKVDQIIVRLLERPRDLLVGVLLGNELTNVALSIVGASITSAWLTQYSMTEQALLSAAIVIPILLILGEITPRRSRQRNPRCSQR